MKKMKWLVVLVLLTALLVRVYKLAEIPAGIYYDEIDLAYQARSLIETGKDYRGSWSPFFVRSFNTDKTPIPVYMNIPAVVIFQTPEFQVRMTTALVGVLVVGLAMLLIWMWTKNKVVVILTGLVFTMNPWLIQFSRIAFEAIYVLFFYLLFLVCFFNWLKQKKLRDYYLSIILLSLGVYVYRIMSLYVPLTFLIVGVIYFKEIWKVGIKHLLGGVILAGAIVLPFMYATTIGSADQTRIEQVSVFSDPLVPIFVIRGREDDSGDYTGEKIGSRPVWFSYIFHNKVVGWMISLKNNYMKSISTEFLFAFGDENLRQGMGKTGALLWIDIIGLGAGLFWLIKHLKEKKYQFLAAWLVTSPLPADLTFDGATHASRLIIMAIPLLLVIGIGWWRILKMMVNWKFGLVWISILGVAYIWVFIFVFHHYLIHFPLEASRWHGYGYKEAILKIDEVDDQYDKVLMTNSNDPFILPYLFWAKVSPAEVQTYGIEYGVETVKGQRLDKYKMMSWSKVTEGYKLPHEMGKALKPGVLYMISQQDAKGDFRPTKGDVPAGVKIIDYVPYPDNSEVAYYLITKKSEN